MATTEGCLDLLSVLASLDPRVKFDAATAYGWAQALAAIPDEVLIPAGMAAARANDQGYPVNVGMIEKQAQPFLRRIARDVRSARIRHLVPDDWPDSRPIPAHAAEALAAEWAANNDGPAEITGPVATTRPELGLRLRDGDQ